MAQDQRHLEGHHDSAGVLKLASAFWRGQIEDLKAQIEEAHTKKGSLQEQIYQSGPSLPENVSKEVHNLNNLVKKKPKKETNGASAPASEQPPSAAEAESTAETSEPVSAVNGKRKAEDEAVSEGADKKVKTHSS